MCICFTSITQNVCTAASMKTYICYDHWLHILCGKMPNFQLFILFCSVQICFVLFQRVCPVLSIFICMNFVWLGFLWVCWSPKGFCNQRIRKHWFKYITSLVMNHVFVIAYIFLPFWALPKSFCCVKVRNVYR